MIVIPYQFSKTQYSIYIGLDEESIGRIKEYDPAAVQLSEFPPWCQQLTLAEVLITYANADDLAQVQKLCDVGHIKAALRHLSRGFRYQPDRGDYDGPPLSMLTDPEDTKH